MSPFDRVFVATICVALMAVLWWHADRVGDTYRPVVATNCHILAVVDHPDPDCP